MSNQPGRWAAWEYVKLLRTLTGRYPSLMNLDFSNEMAMMNRSCRVGMIEVPGYEGTDHKFESPQELHDHLAKQELVPPAPRCRVYIVENLDIEYIAAFGYHFKMDPTVFASQVRTANWVFRPNDNITPKLLQCRDPKRSFVLRYGELRFFKEYIAGLPLTDYTAGRRIFTVTKSMPELSNFGHVGIVRRCISFWCQESYPGCWDGKAC